MSLPLPERLDTAEILAEHIAALCLRDERLLAVVSQVGAVPTRRNAPGFGGMARIVCGQLLSVASANAIWARYELVPGALDAAQFLAIEEAAIRAVGFSGGKYKTLRVVAEAIVEGRLDLTHLETLPAEEALTVLTGLKGIGPWTAEVYLLFCAGHPDIFPAGDLALRKAVGEAFGMAQMPSIRDLHQIARTWSPHRGAAALLFWRYFAALKNKEGIGL